MVCILSRSIALLSTVQELVEAFAQANAALNDILPAKLQSPAELRSSYGVFQKLYREAIQDIHHAESVRYCIQ